MIKVSVVLVGLLFSNSLYALSDSVVKQAIKTAGSVATAAINKNKSEVDIQNSLIKNKVKIKNGSIIVGNGGNRIKSDNVKIVNSEISNDLEMDHSYAVGNLGNDIGK